VLIHFFVCLFSFSCHPCIYFLIFSLKVSAFGTTSVTNRPVQTYGTRKIKTESNRSSASPPLVAALSMKFGHEIEVQCEFLPPGYRENVLSYKKLKKMLKVIVNDMESQGLSPELLRTLLRRSLSSSSSVGGSGSAVLGMVQPAYPQPDLTPTCRMEAGAIHPILELNAIPSLLPSPSFLLAGLPGDPLDPLTSCCHHVSCKFLPNMSYVLKPPSPSLPDRPLKLDSEDTASLNACGDAGGLSLDRRAPIFDSFLVIENDAASHHPLSEALYHRHGHRRIVDACSDDSRSGYVLVLRSLF
jgi:hypothetical protein